MFYMTIRIGKVIIHWSWGYSDFRLTQMFKGKFLSRNHRGVSSEFSLNQSNEWPVFAILRAEMDGHGDEPVGA